MTNHCKLRFKICKTYAWYRIWNIDYFQYCSLEFSGLFRACKKKHVLLSVRYHGLFALKLMLNERSLLFFQMKKCFFFSTWANLRWTRENLVSGEALFNLFFLHVIIYRFFLHINVFFFVSYHKSKMAVTLNFRATVRHIRIVEWLRVYESETTRKVWKNNISVLKMLVLLVWVFLGNRVFMKFVRLTCIWVYLSQFGWDL